MTAKDINTKRATLSETKETLIMQYTNDELIERAKNAVRVWRYKDEEKTEEFLKSLIDE